MMKIFLMTLIFSSFAWASQPQILRLPVEPSSTSDSGWQPLRHVLYSNYGSVLDTRRACEDDAQTLQLLGNDRVVFQATCAASSNAKCSSYDCFELSAKVLVVPAN